MSLLAASAYLKSKRLASSRNLIRDNLEQKSGLRALSMGTGALQPQNSPRGDCT